MSRLSVGNDGKMIILAGTYQLGAAIAAADDICAQRVEFDRATTEGAAQCDDENKKEALDCSNHEPHHRTKHTIWSMNWKSGSVLTLDTHPRIAQAFMGNAAAASHST